MDETEVIYGTIGTVPMGEYDPDKQYDLLNLVSFDGSSYVVHTKPPIGTLPTVLDYWQVSAQGTGKATADSVGTVKPDGTTTEVSADGSLSVKTATQGGLGVVKGSNGIKVGDDGSIDINTVFDQATELANIIAGEAIASALGKISKSIAVTMGLDQNALLKSMLTNIDTNDQNKIPTSALVHTLIERIGMGEELATGANLTAAFNTLNSNLSTKANASDLGFDQTEHRVGEYKGKALYAKTVFVTHSVNATWQAIYTVSGATLVLIDYGKSYIIDGSLVMPLESKDGSGVISRCTGASVQCYCYSDKTYEFALSVMYTKD